MTAAYDLLPVRIVSGCLLTELLPPLSNQRGTLIVSRSEERWAAMFAAGCEMFPEVKVLRTRGRLRWKNGDAIFGCAADFDQPDLRLGVHRFGGLEFQALGIDRISDFGQEEIDYLRCMTRSRYPSFAPFVLATP